MKRWSKLQKLVHNLFDENLNMQLHCTPYRMKSQRGSTPLGRYWITLDGEIIYDYPGVKKAVKDYPYERDISSISETLRSYVDCPRENLLGDLPDQFGILDVIRAADRRLGKQNLTGWAASKGDVVMKVILKRFGE